MKDQNVLPVHPDLSLFDVLPKWPETSSSHSFGDGNLSFDVVEITPQLAAQFLRTQSSNRKVNSPRVAEYARRQEQGEWSLSDAIKFDEAGHLIDGQHRLMAVCRSGISLSFPVISGYPKHSQDVLDIGMNRTVAQIAQIQGLTVTNSHVSIVRALFLPTINNRSFTTMLSSPQKVINLINEHKDAINFSIKLHGTASLKHAAVRAVVARAWYYENHKRLEEFLSVFDTGFGNGPEDNAAVALRNAIMHLKASKVESASNSMTRVSVALKTISALEAFLAKEDRKFIRERTLGSCKWKVKGVDA